MNQEVTITVSAADARLMGEALLEMRREWADEADEHGGTAAMQRDAAERVGGELHTAGWNAAR